jgi:hypothetical protein
MFKRKKTVSPALQITEMYNNQISKRNSYYADLICDLYKSKAQSLSNSLYLDKSKLYGYYEYDERVIVFWNKEVSDILKRNGIDSWNDSVGGLIIGLIKNG